MAMGDDNIKLCTIFFLFFVKLSYSVTDPNDLKVLMAFKNGLDNPELLKWPANGNDPCGPPSWPHVFCSNGRITQIQVQKLGLKGSLPQNFNQLSKLYNIGLQNNHFNGHLPTFKGLSELQFAFLDFNEFDTIPSDFFDGLSSIRVLALDENPFNQSTGWSLPSQIPASFGQSLMTVLWLNNQERNGMSGSIDVIAKMTSLRQLWLQGNSFTGTIPENIGGLSLLKDLNLNGNQLVGFVPQGLADMVLDNLDLNNNHLMGPIPTFKAGKISYDSNSFCHSKPGVLCAPQVNALLDFLGGLDYPLSLVSQWSGNDPCQGPWLGLNCDLKSKVYVINLPRHNLTGTLSPSIAKLDSLVQINLGKNHINGTIPSNWTKLNSLKLLDVSGNNLSPPFPKFQKSVKLIIVGNPLLVSNQSQQTPSPTSSPPFGISLPPSNNRSGSAQPSASTTPPPPTKSSNTNSSGFILSSYQSNNSKRTKLLIAGGITAGSLLVLVVIALSIYYLFKKRKETSELPSSIVVHPRDPSDPENIVKIAVSNNTIESLSTQTATSYGSNATSVVENSRVLEAGNLIISVQVLRKVTKGFAPENKLGHGGFGTVYKGELEDGTKIAVKRMEAGVIGSKALDEFQAEIAVLSKVRHRHLVSLLVMGKITTKSDVFSYGVVLMELLTGLMALDEERSEESRYLAEWFWRIKSSKEKLMASIDPSIDPNEETHESISIVAELAGHCTAREPSHRPDMGHAVSLLAPLVEKWKPIKDESEDFSGIDYSLPLPQMLKFWQDAESTGVSYTSFGDSKGSIPARPTGFAESFTSSDGR
ncbi:hypothetical protein GH714_000459 [Hevea brasiliensis]|uniref:Protein kinase domain-containing protein n=1 Tax=Hevea brasiliensis TaxID=3981 RepID=A0A6A6NAI5_HEVBR|nr:hypothetical protein GH714_000459 [Hevea brasiliensis]